VHRWSVQAPQIHISLAAIQMASLTSSFCDLFIPTHLENLAYNKILAMVFYFVKKKSE
jgi:hypothetical protein